MTYNILVSCHPKYHLTMQGGWGVIIIIITDILSLHTKRYGRGHFL